MKIKVSVLDFILFQVLFYVKMKSFKDTDMNALD